MSERFSDYVDEMAFLEILKSFRYTNNSNDFLSLKKIIRNQSDKNTSSDILTKALKKGSDDNVKRLNQKEYFDKMLNKKIKTYNINFSMYKGRILRKHHIRKENDKLIYKEGKINNEGMLIEGEEISGEDWMLFIRDVVLGYETVLKGKYQQFLRRTEFKNKGKNRKPISLNNFCGVPLSLVKRRIMGLLISSDFITNKNTISSKLELLKQMQTFYDIELTNQKSSIYETIDRLVDDKYLQFDGKITINNKFYEKLKQVLEPLKMDLCINDSIFELFDRVLNIEKNGKNTKDLYNNEIKDFYVSAHKDYSDSDIFGFILNFFLKQL